MPCPRLLTGALLLGLLPCLACIENTIELATTDSSSADDEGSTASTDTSAGVTTTASTTTASTTTASTTTSTTASTTPPSDESDSAITTVGPTLDIGVDPGEPQTMLWAVDTVLSPGLPFQGLVRFQHGDGNTVEILLQWLSLEQGSTTVPREPVGDLYAYEAIPVADDGSFVWVTGAIVIPAAANPITGSDVVVSITAEATPLGQPYCGEVSGEVTSPIVVPLDGSTHALTSITSVDDLPLEFPWSCQ